MNFILTQKWNVKRWIEREKNPNDLANEYTHRRANTSAEPVEKLIQ